MRKAAAEPQDCDLLNTFVERKFEYPVTDLPPSVTAPSSRHCINTWSGSLHHNHSHHFLLKVADVTHNVATSGFQMDLVSRECFNSNTLDVLWPLRTLLLSGASQMNCYVQECPNFSCK